MRAGLAQRYGRLCLGPAALVLGLLSACVPSPEVSTGIEALAEERQSDAQNDAKRHPLTAALSREDLPPEGTRSLFDQLIARHGSLPYPFPKLVAAMQEAAGAEAEPEQMLIPDGRSLLKGHAHFGAPRIVYAADTDPPAGAVLPARLRGRLFLGFVEEANEIEVLSYNSAAGRFEFQLVEDYCQGCIPRIVYAKRAICTTCHAGGSPIFPVRPWRETNANRDIRARLQEALQSAHYQQVPVTRSLDDAQRFDDLTNMGNVLMVTQRIWLDGCGEQGQACRRALLSAALQYGLNPTSLSPDSNAARTLTQQQAAVWPSQGIAHINNDLGNRNPLEQELYSDSLWVRMRAIFAPAPAREQSLDKLAAFDRLPPLPPELDPLSQRPPKQWIDASSLDGAYALAQLFSPADWAQLEQLANYDAAKLQQAAAQMPDEIFAAQPVVRETLIQALSAALGAEPQAYVFDDGHVFSAPILQGEPPLELAADSVLQPYAEYCFACHRGNPSAELNFMSGPDEAIVLANIQDRSEIREVLDFERYLGTRKEGQLMPPADSWQREALMQAHTQAVENGGESPIADMRAQIPTLFDF